MVGKGSLIVILGFSMIFGVAGQYWNRMSTSAMENFSNYYDSTAAHNVAISAANILADSIFWNQSATSINSSPVSFNGGKYTLRTQRVVINGDSDVLATVQATYSGFRGHTIIDSVQILLHPARFSEYAYFTNSDNGVYWTTGERMNGPYHTNGTLMLSGSPIFTGSVTTGTGIGTQYQNPISPSQLPDSHGDRLNCGSYQSGVYIPLPTSLASYNALPGVTVFQNSDSHSSYNYDVYVTFSSSDPTKVNFHSELKNGSTMVTRVPASGDSTVSISALAGGSNVVIVNNGDLHISGNMDGNITFVAEQGNRPSKSASSSSYTPGSSVDDNGYNLYVANSNHTYNGNVILEGSVTYANDPTSNPASPDMLGLVAQNSVMLKTQPTGQSVNIDAGIFAMSGRFLYQNYDKIGRAHV